MTNQEINKALALAIGYTPERVRNIHGWVEVRNDYSRMDGPRPYSGWQRFDHTDPAVIWPIAKKFDCFPARFFDGWYSFGHRHDCPETATALALTYVKGAKQ